MVGFLSFALSSLSTVVAAMADGVQFPSANSVGVAASVPTSKRKYDDRSITPPPPSSTMRRPTGFSSSPITSSAPDSAAALPPSYTGAPPPMDDIQIAKQRAQEIAARLFSSIDPKGPRADNGSDQKLPFSNFHSGFGGYGYQGTSKKMEIPNTRVGVIIGKSGETVKYLQLQSGAKIQITRDMDADPNSQTRLVELTGTQEQIDKAEQLVNDVLAEAEAGASSLVNKRLNGQAGAEPFIMRIPNNRVGLVIGKGGETIKNMQATTGARIQVVPLHLPPGDMSTERTIQIDGTSEQIESAQQMVNEVVNVNRNRNNAVGGYTSNNQQGYQQSYQQPQQQHPPANWGGAPAMQQPQQQPGYGYVQQPLPPQYGLPQPAAYPGYPPQSAGYPSSWDMTTQNPQGNPGGGYDYSTQQGTQQAQTGTPSGTYQQQQQQTAAAPSYSYPQPFTSGYPQPQGQTANPQDGYGGCGSQPSLYGQQQNPMPGYDQGYTSTAQSQTQDGSAAQAAPPMQSPAAHGYGGGGGTQQQTSPNTCYGTPAQPASGQPGYGNPATMMMGQPGYGYGGGYMNPAGTYAQPLGIPPPITQQQNAVYGQVEASCPQPNYTGGYGMGYGGQPLPVPGGGGEKIAAVAGGKPIGTSP